MGHYQIGPRIGAGGMAEVYLGTHQAMGGFRKLVVMKRLLGWQSGDEAAVESLLDEARIAGTINHPNVVTTLDIGLDRGSPYIVLEYLSGEDLLYVLHELHQRDASIPLGIVCRIGASIAAALAQAHDLTLPDGSHRCIVHRDVTPSNIIVCYSGVTKLVDFGVARIADDEPKTKAGIVKGKFSYLAPEQLKGETLDGRTDVFQLGIVLWEMATMARLFDGKTDHERVNAVLNRTIRPPSKLNPAIPPCLDRTIMRALDRDPTRRHASAHELESDLLEALNALGASGGDHSVGKWMQSAFPERFAWRQDLERRTVNEAEEDDLEVSVESDEPGSPWSHRRIATGATMHDHGSSLRGLAVEASVAPKPRSSLGRFVIPAVVVATAAIWWVQGGRDLFGEQEPHAVATTTAAAKDYEVDIRVMPAHANIAIDGVVIANGRYRTSFASDGVVHTVTLTAPDFSTVERRLSSATMLEVNLESLAPAVAKPDVPAVSDVTPPAGQDAAKPGEVNRDARHRRRDRPGTSAQNAAAAPVEKPGTDSGANANDAGSAAPAARAKPADDPFAPSSDNIDPFKK